MRASGAGRTNPAKTRRPRPAPAWRAGLSAEQTPVGPFANRRVMKSIPGGCTVDRQKRGKA
jgi:hypothetical protein